MPKGSWTAIHCWWWVLAAKRKKIANKNNSFRKTEIDFYHAFLQQLQSRKNHRFHELCIFFPWNFFTTLSFTPWSHYYYYYFIITRCNELSMEKKLLTPTHCHARLFPIFLNSFHHHHTPEWKTPTFYSK